MPDSIRTETDGPVTILTIDRPERRNAIDPATAKELAAAFRAVEADDDAAVAVLTGAGDHFCAGADLKAIARGDVHTVDPDLSEDGPLGPTRMRLSTPVIAAVSGYAVAGGLELACWCDLRVVDPTAVFGVFCRRYGVPLVDGGTQRLPQIVGLGRALDLILTGRPVDAEEARDMGLATRVVEPGTVLDEAIALARQIAAFPQDCLRSDREAVYRGLDLDGDAGLHLEARLGRAILDAGSPQAGAQRFVDEE